MQKFFEPASVVLIGVSRQTGPGAYNNLEMLLSYGYQGRIYLVHPKVPEILGHRTYPRLADLPEVPDLAVISLGRERVLPAFQECAALGIKRVVVISQGFADADDRGKELQAQLVALAREHGVRFLGPNTMGVLNPLAGFSTAFVDIPWEAAPVPLTMVAQSGVFQVGASSFTGRMGKAIDVGNAGDVDVVDVLEYLEHDPETRIIVLHLEGMKQGRRFLEVAGRIVPQKPIIALKTGRSAAGALAAMSHTGSMVGEDAVFDLAFREAGIIRARSLVELRAICTGLPPFPAHARAAAGHGDRHRGLRHHHRRRLCRLRPGTGPLSRSSPGTGRGTHRLAPAPQPGGYLAPGDGDGVLYRGLSPRRGRSVGQRPGGWGHRGGAGLSLALPCGYRHGRHG